MKRRNTCRNRTSTSADNGLAFFPWTHFAITAIAAVALAAGLFFAASRHFSSMELGIKNAKLRSQLAELENEKRRLELSREIALTPSELKRNAKTLGFRAASEFVAVAVKPPPSDAPANVVTEVAKLEKEKGDKAIVTKIAVADSSRKTETKTVAETRQRTVLPKTQEKPAKVAVDSRPRIVAASAEETKPDPRKLVKKTVMSNPTNRSSENKAVAKLK